MVVESGDLIADLNKKFRFVVKKFSGHLCYRVVIVFAVLVPLLLMRRRRRNGIQPDDFARAIW
jgi:hypothetical protein